MIIVRKRGDGMEFEFPTVLDESGSPQLVYFGSEPDNDLVQSAHLVDKEVEEIGHGCGRVDVGDEHSALAG